MRKTVVSLISAVVAAQLCACAVTKSPEPKYSSEETPIKGAAQLSLSQAMEWAAAHDASELFLDIAPYYWEYGENTGIRPEIMYAQAAKETAYGAFGGSVTPDMYNFAGIKKAGATGDEKDDHETFLTPEDGVRAHYNHMCAYIGLNPIGTPHDRYYLVLSTDWAGTITAAEQLGGRWCPDPDYGKDIVNKYLADMFTFADTSEARIVLPIQKSQ